MRTLYLLLTLLLLSAPPLSAEEEAPAPDAAPRVDPQQQRMAELRALKLEGEQLELMGAEGTVFALYLPDGSGKALGAVILLHDQHNHLVAQPLETLRLGLPRHGWDTLTVQLPPKPMENGLSWLDRSADVLDAALAHLQGMGKEKIVLIAHGSGGLLALDKLFNTSREQVAGLVLLSLDGHAHEEARLDAARQLAQVSIPVLDIQAQHDHPRVTSSAERRARLAQAPAPEGADDRLRYRDIAASYSPDKGDRIHYRQLQIPTADHTYQPNQEGLLRAVRGWLQRHIQ